MGIKNLMVKAGEKTANKVARLSALSSDQLLQVSDKREEYLSQKPDPTDVTALEMTSRLLAAGGVEIFDAFLPQIKDLYMPIHNAVEFDHEFNESYNIRYINITKWVTDKKENNLEKLINVYAVLSNEICNIALIFHRAYNKTDVYIAVVNMENADSNVDVDNYMKRLTEAIRGNFPGAEWKKEIGIGTVPCLKNHTKYSVAAATNIPTEKSEKFTSQTIEKLLDGIVPDSKESEYTLILLATPIQDVEERKMRLSQYYSALHPYASWSTQFTLHENNSIGSTATVGINVGASAGVQNGVNQSIARGQGETDSVTTGETQSEGTSETDTVGETTSDATSNTEGTTTTEGSSYSSSHTEGSSSGGSFTEGRNASYTQGASAHVGVGVPGGTNAGVSTNHSFTAGLSLSASQNWGKTVSDAVTNATNQSVSKNIAQTITRTAAKSTSKAVSKQVTNAITNTLGKAVSNTVTKTSGISKAVNMGLNFGANFARSSSVTATIGRDEGITQNFANYNIKHAMDMLEQQMKRFETSSALGMWDFAAYVLSEDQNVANNVAHTYLALTQGEESYMSKSAVNLWRGDTVDDKDGAAEICTYLRDLRHPLFGLKPALVDADNTFYVYPPVVTATTGLSGKELAYSLNFPKKSIPGLPVFECAEFGRNIVTYEPVDKGADQLRIGNIFHMNHEERGEVLLAKDSLASHTFITGSTGAGKSNTVYKILDESMQAGCKFLVIEPAKGEYKHVFGIDEDVYVYGTNPAITPMLRLNPFSFPEGIHVLEHLDRLVEIFNVCWPMYAAMPAVLKNAIEKSYEDCGWNLVRSENELGVALYPTFADVAGNVRTIIDTSEYDAENKGAYKGSLLTRLQSLTNGINGMMFTTNEIDAADLFDRDVIVDISRVGSSETKSLLMGMLILKLQEYRMASTSGMNQHLKHLTVLEEAHNILKRTSSEQAMESSNLMGKSVEMISNAIAEMRTYGEGFIIADQAPGLLDMSAIRNTNTKIIMRLPDLSDRELVGKAANLNDDQINELAKLPRGVAAIYQNEWIQPVLCKVDRYEHSQGRYVPVEESFIDETITFKAREELLNYIMNHIEHLNASIDDMENITSMILQSGLETDVKVDFIRSLNCTGDMARKQFRKLVYDYFDTEKAFTAAEDCDEIREWTRAFVSEIKPSIISYPDRLIDLVVANILYERTLRDSVYNNVFNRFTEIYREDGRVF